MNRIIIKNLAKNIRYNIEYICVKLLFNIIGVLKFEQIYKLSEVTGIFFYKYIFIRKKIFFKNLKIIFKNRRTSFYNEQAKKVCINFSKTFLEFFKLSSLNKNNIDRYIKFKNINYIDEALKRKKGVILVTGHINNWEFVGYALALKNYPIYAMAKRQDNRLVDKLINKQRELSGMKIIYKGINAKELFRALKKNYIIAMLGDVHGVPENINSIFFGEPVSTPTGTALFGYRTSAPIIPIFSYRDENNIHKVIIEEEIISTSNNREEFVNDIISCYNKRLENFIMNHPDQWFYFHNRFKIKR